MDELALSVQSIGKKYRLGLTHKSMGTLGEAITRVAKRPFGGAAFPSEAAERSEVWAVRDASFDVRPGEILGIIGRNGAGKTTLLKLISRITEPTTGKIIVRGRVASLLEVGTGFHPEFTGRENVYLNGAILGMTRAEIEGKFDEIVAFSGVERFIDTPIKRYSTGMQVRLAFAVAAHLESEILLIDEVLAVGDVEFQKKCLGKMEEVGATGRTVLFVSHNVSKVMRLCSRVILLDDGRLQADGEPESVIKRYLDSGLGGAAERIWPDVTTAPGSDVVRLLAVRIHSGNGAVKETVEIDEPIAAELEYEVLEGGSVLNPSIQVFNDEGVWIFNALDLHSKEWSNAPRPIGRYKTICWIPGNLMAEGQFYLGVSIRSLDRTPSVKHMYEQDLVSFFVKDRQDAGTVRGATWAGKIQGVVRPLLKWETDKIK